MLTRPLCNLFALALGELDAELSESETDFPNGIFEICISPLRELTQDLEPGRLDGVVEEQIRELLRYVDDYSDTYKLKRLLRWGPWFDD